MPLPGWIKFALVGGTAFVVDFCLFSLLTLIVKLDPYSARALAFVVAASTTWLGNRYFTFAERSHCQARRQWVKALSAALFSALPNFAVFSLVLEWSVGWPYAAWVALIAGIAAGTTSNYALSYFWVYRSQVES